jgi:2-iminoacetate synthase
MMSAGSHTEPGGYTRKAENTHRRPRAIVAPNIKTAKINRDRSIRDQRRTFPGEIAVVLRRRGLEPVWKDWDQALCGA